MKKKNDPSKKINIDIPLDSPDELSVEAIVEQFRSRPSAQPTPVKPEPTPATPPSLYELAYGPDSARGDMPADGGRKSPGGRAAAPSAAGEDAQSSGGAAAARYGENAKSSAGRAAAPSAGAESAKSSAGQTAVRYGESAQSSADTVTSSGGAAGRYANDKPGDVASPAANDDISSAKPFFGGRKAAEAAQRGSTPADEAAKEVSGGTASRYGEDVKSSAGQGLSSADTVTSSAGRAAAPSAGAESAQSSAGQTAVRYGEDVKSSAGRAAAPSAGAESAQSSAGAAGRYANDKPAEVASPATNDDISSANAAKFSSALTSDELSVGAPEDPGPVIDLRAFDAVYRRTQLRRKVVKEKILADNARELRLAMRQNRRISRIKAVRIEGAAPAPLPREAKKELEREINKKPEGKRFIYPSSIALRKVRYVRAARPAETDPEINSLKLERRLLKLRRSIYARMTIAFLFSLPLAVLSCADSLSLPIPAAIAFASSPQTHLLATLGLMLAVCLAGYDVILGGIVNMLRLRLTGDSLTAVSALSAAAYCVFALLTGNFAFQPLCALPALAVAFSLLGDRLSHATYYRSFRSCSRLAKCSTLSLLPDRYGKDGVYACGTARSKAGFYGSFFEEDLSAGVMSAVAPLLALSSLFIAVFCSSLPGDRPPFLWCWSVISSFAPALGIFLCVCLPYRRLTKKLIKQDVLPGGAGAVCRAAGKAYVMITDTDIFPGSAIEWGGLKMISGEPAEAVSAAASLLSAAGTPLADPFVSAAAQMFAPIRPVESLTFREPGGIFGEIDGVPAAVGSAEYMRAAGVSLPENVKLRTAVFIAIDGELRAVAAIVYRALPDVEYALSLLLSNGYVPIVASRDFNITPELLSSKFGVRPSEIIFPSYPTRASMDGKGRLLPSEGILLPSHPKRSELRPVAVALVGCRRCRAAMRISLALSLLSAFLGIFLGTLMCFNLWTLVATPLNMLLYYILWLIPVLLFAGWVNKY